MIWALKVDVEFWGCFMRRYHGLELGLGFRLMYGDTRDDMIMNLVYVHRNSVGWEVLLNIVGGR